VTSTTTPGTIKAAMGVTAVSTPINMMSVASPVVKARGLTSNGRKSSSKSI